MIERTRPPRAFTLLETLAAIVTVVGVLSALTLTQAAVNRYSAMQLMRSRCVAAAEAEIGRLARSARATSAETVADRWPGVTLSRHRSPGEGDWEGLERLTVTARGRHDRLSRPVVVTLHRYVSPEGRP